jgi:hypothetical protein
MGYLSLLYGFCEPMYNDSGNGAHLLYPINEANTRKYAMRYTSSSSAFLPSSAIMQVKVDTTVFNAARIWRVPGTWSRKGDSVPDRPHRKARLCSTYTILTALRLLAFMLSLPRMKGCCLIRIARWYASKQVGRRVPRRRAQVQDAERPCHAPDTRMGT